MRVRDPEQLRLWRQRRGLSQRDLAYLCRCTQATISLLERGTMHTLRDELALALAARLQVPWEELFEPRTAEGPTNPANALWVGGQPATGTPTPSGSSDDESVAGAPPARSSGR